MIFLASVLAALALAGATRLLLERRRIPGRRSQPAVWGTAALSAGLALAAPGAPTGYLVLDGLYRALFGAAVVLAAAKARRWTWVVAAGAAVIADHGSVVGIPAGAALGVAVASTGTRRPGRLVGAAVGVAVAQGLLHIRWAHPLGASAAVAAAVLALLTMSHLARMRSRARRPVWIGALVILAAAGAASAAYGAAAVSVRHYAQAGLDDAEAALSDARAGDANAAAGQLRAAATALDRVQARTAAWWDYPARAVPLAGQNVRAVAVAVGQARAVLAQGAALVDAARARDLRVHNGTVDLARVRALAPRVASSKSTLDAAASAVSSLRSPWLLAPLRIRLDRLSGKLDQTASGEATLSLATSQLPSILGGDGPRHWLLAIMDNSELRGGGGLISAAGELDADGGHLTLHSLQTLGFNLSPPPGGAKITGPTDWVRRYQGFRPDLYIWDDAYSPDFPSDAEVLRQVYPQWLGRPVDGVIGIDPFGLAALLRVTGPVSVPSWPAPITADDAVPILLHDQYLSLAGGGPRSQFLVDLGHRIFNQLTTGDLPGPATLAATLGTALPGHHIQLWSPRPPEEGLFSGIGASGAMAPVRGDYLEVVTQNASNTKGDWFLTRAISYRATFDPTTGLDRAQVSLTLHSSAPTSGEPAVVVGGTGTLGPANQDRQWVSIYSGLDLSGATLDGRPVALQREHERGRQVFSGYVTVASGGTETLTLSLNGVTPGGPGYHLDVGYQPAPDPDALHVSVETRSPAGAPVRRRWDLQQNREVGLALG